MQVSNPSSRTERQAPKLALRTLAAGLACAFACTLPSTASAHKPGNPCRDQRLSGLYVFAANGHNIVGGAALPKAIVELLSFNGDGTVTTPGLTLSINGNIVQLPNGNPGTYSLGEDCRGTLIFADGPAFDFTADPAGGTLWLIQTNPNTVFQGTARRISR